MIKPVLNNLVNLIVQTTGLGDHIEIANISMIHDGDEFLESDKPILVSVINVEEDRTLRNQSIYNYEANPKKVISKFSHPTQHLVLSVLFAAYQKNKKSINYIDGIDNLEKIISFFQANNSFYQDTTNFAKPILTFAQYEVAISNPMENPDNYAKITTEFVSLSSEQQNHIWTYLGSKYMPSVLYKLRLLPIQQNQASAPVDDIESVVIQHLKKKSNDPLDILESNEFEKQIINGKEVIVKINN